jgi:chemotaxis protein methyltransferase CheR
MSQAVNIAALRADLQYPALKNYVLQHTGLCYYADKDDDFAARLSRRFSTCGIEKCDAYLRLLGDPQTGKTEMDCLVGELTIGETYFFRQQEHFNLLRHTIIPNILERNRESRALRVWSAGCATGAEPYSISLLLQQEFGRQLAGWDVSILATDINVDFLAQAKAAAYPEWTLRDLPKDLRNRYFTRENSLWHLRPELSGNVIFQYHNLAGDVELPGSFEKFDLIACRNVIIYFSREGTMRVIERLHRSLSPGGWLLVGYAELNMGMFRTFETLSTIEATAYRKPLDNTQAVRAEIPWQPLVWKEPGEMPDAKRQTREPDAEPVLPATAPASPVLPTVDDVRTLADTGNWDVATRLAETLVESDSLNPATHFTSALIHEHQGSVQRARAEFLRAIYLDRNFALAHYHLGTSLLSTLELEPANRCFRNALEILTALPDDEPIQYGDSLTAGELRSLAAAHLEMNRL